MLNAVKYEYSNGPLEGFNNKIKLLKRVSYGYSENDKIRMYSFDKIKMYK